MSWHLLVDPPLPGWANMSRDLGLLDLAEASGAVWVRLYRWEPFCLSFGRHEPAHRRYDRERIEAEGLDVVRRPTGGRAVWHARELTYAIGAPVACFGSLPDSYLALHALLVKALLSLGIDATLAPRPARAAALEAGACFASAAGGEVLLAGRKLIGSAQYRQGSALLQHGSLLLEDSQELIARVTRGAAPHSDAAPLSELHDRPVSFTDAVRAVAEVFSAHWTDPTPIMGDPLHAAASAHAARFRSPEWTWRR